MEYLNKNRKKTDTIKIRKKKFVKYKASKNISYRLNPLLLTTDWYIIPNMHTITKGDIPTQQNYFFFLFEKGIFSDPILDILTRKKKLDACSCIVIN